MDTNWGAPIPTGGAKRYKIIRGQYSRIEGEKGKEKHVHYGPGEGKESDIVTMTDAQAEKFGRRHLVQVTEGGSLVPTAEQAAIIKEQETVITSSRRKKASA